MFTLWYDADAAWAFVPSRLGQQKLQPWLSGEILIVVGPHVHASAAAGSRTRQERSIRA